MIRLVAGATAGALAGVFVALDLVLLGTIAFATPWPLVLGSLGAVLGGTLGRLAGRRARKPVTTDAG